MILKTNGNLYYAEKVPSCQYMIGQVRRAEIVRAIRNYWKQHGYAPTVRDIRNATGISSTHTAMHHLLILRSRGIIDWTDYEARTIHIVQSEA